MWVPHPKQAEFLAASESEVLFGGAAGPGKTECLVLDSLGINVEALQYPRYRAILFRDSFPNLRPVIDRSLQYFPQIVPGAKYNSGEHFWTFPSGAQIIMGYMDREDTMYDHQGAEYQWIGWDELTLQKSKRPYDYLMSRLRCAWGSVPCFVRSTANPGGPGHVWVKEHFGIEGRGAATRFATVQEIDYPEGRRKVELTRRFIPATLNDNPSMDRNDPLYRARLNQMTKRDKERLLDGRWDVVEGQFFEEYDPDIHIVKPIPIPPSWKRWRAMDWGFSKPYSVGWYCQDFDGNIFRYRELYGCKRDGAGKWLANTGTREYAADVAARVKEIEKGERDMGIEFRNNVADPAIWSPTGVSAAQERSIGDTFNANGVLFNQAGITERSRLLGWHEMKARMANSVRRLANGFYVFNTCQHWIRTVPTLICDAQNSDDCDTEMEDHAGDETRYSLISRRLPSAPAAKDGDYRPGTLGDLLRRRA